MRALTLALTVIASGGSALAQPSLSVAKHNSELMEQVSAANGVFAVGSDGAIRHIQSGMLCPADLQNVHFAAPLIYATSPVGLDVGCDYGRGSFGRGFVSKLTIFAVKAPEGMTLDSAFEKYEQEVASTYPGATKTPAALQIGDGAGNTSTNYRAIGYSITLNDKVAHSELIVGIFSGWILEVRATYPNSIIQADKNTTREQLRDQLFDIESPYIAFMSARDSLIASGTVTP